MSEKKKNVLIIEDDSSVGDDIKNMLSKIRIDVESNVVNFNEAKDSIEKYTPDVIILDLLAEVDSPEPASPGNDIFDWIWDSRFCPIIVHSARPEVLTEDRDIDHPFVKIVKKGKTSLEQINTSLAELNPQVEALHEAEKYIRQQFAFALREVAPYAFEIFKESSESVKRNDMIVRAGRRRLAALMDDLSRHGQTLVSWEQYISPPVSQDLQLGDVLRKADKSVDDPGSFYLVLTPSCDLVVSRGRRPKVINVLVACCCSTREALKHMNIEPGKKKLQEKPEEFKEQFIKTVLSQGYYKEIIPFPRLEGRIPEMGANLRLLEFISIEDIGFSDKTYLRIASLDSPFRELVSWAYLQIACRPGLPVRDFNKWCEEIVALLQAEGGNE